MAKKEELNSKIAQLKSKIEESGLLREVLQKKFSEKKDESVCFQAMNDLVQQHFVPFEMMGSNEFKLMILDKEFMSESTSQKSFSDAKFDKAVQSNELVKSEFVQNLKLKVTYRQCKRCERDFLPILNDANSCKYHPGNKKYFSCKNCGKDAYYTCCNWCSECIEGCMLTFHV